MTYKSTELAEKFEYSSTQWRRWSRELIGEDKNAGMQKGRVREYSTDEAFKVFLGGYLITKVLMPIKEVKDIIDNLIKWTNKNSLMKPKKTESEIKEWRIYIRVGSKVVKGKKKIGYYITAQGVIDYKEEKKSGKDIFTESYINELIRRDNMRFGPNLKIIHPEVIIADFNSKLGLSKGEKKDKREPETGAGWV